MLFDQAVYEYAKSAGASSSVFSSAFRRGGAFVSDVAIGALSPASGTCWVSFVRNQAANAAFSFIAIIPE